MNDFLIYLLKVSLGISVLTIPYLLFMRKDPMLFMKRLYLLSGLALAWIFPTISLQRNVLPIQGEPVVFIDPGVNPTPVNLSHIDSGTSFNPFLLIMLLYFIGIAALLILNMKRLQRVNKGKKQFLPGSSHIRITNQKQVFTIFPRIFLPEKYLEDPDLDSILIHEEAHIRQLHFLDLLVSELTLLLTWFNPFSWLISRMIKENHEHLADRHVLSTGVHAARYKALLLNHAMGAQVFPLGHKFNQSLTKNRFNMMKKMKTPRKGYFKYILLIPFILSFTLVVTAKPQGSKDIHGKVYLENKDTPATGASVIVLEKNSDRITRGTVVDRDGKFTVTVDGDPELVVSFVGYKSEKLRASDLKNKPLIMERTSINIKPEKAKAVKSPEKIVKVRVADDDKDFNTNMKTDDVIIKTKKGEEPVYVVDGEVVKTIKDLNSMDIESVEVIKTKDDPLVKKYNAKNGVILISTKKKKKSSPEEEEEIFFIVEELPSFPGGNFELGQYLKTHQKYPAAAKKNQITGKVLVQFRVQADGSLNEFKIVRGVDPSLDKAAMELCKGMPDWNPAKQRGKRVACNVIVPIVYALDGN